MLHDLDLKTNYSYGEMGPGAVLDHVKEQGIDMVALTDLFTVAHNREAFDSLKYVEESSVATRKIKYYTGTEWHTLYRMRNIYRVDIIFVDFRIDDKLIAWENLETRLRKERIGRLPPDLNYEDSWLNPHYFGEELRRRRLNAAYFRTLPKMCNIIEKFKCYGGKVILKDIPFTTSYLTKLKILKHLKEKYDLIGMIVFKNEDRYIQTEKEIQKSLDICRATDLLPIVGSGVYKNYDTRSVALEIAGEQAFSFLSIELMQRIAGIK